MIHYEDLTIALTEDGSQIEVWGSPFGRGQKAPFTPPEIGAPMEELLRGAEMDLRDMRRSVAGPTVPAEIRRLGEKLFAALFPEPIADLLLRCATQAETSDGKIGVRIRLVLRWPERLRHLQALPWETIAQLGGRHLSRQPWTSVVRTPLALGHAARRPPVEPPLRVLFLLSQPDDADPLQLEAEKKRVADGFASSAALYGIAPPQLEVMAAPLTVDAFRAVLRKGFHVVHFAGHGDFDERGHGALLFENAQGKARPFAGAQLAEHLLLCPSLRLVVLNACWSALPGVDGEGEPDLGVGTALAEAGVPAVVAMQRPIADAAAIELAGNLYSHLILGDPLELALCHGRIALAEKFPDSPSWAVPVLLLGADSGEIVVPPGRPADGAAPITRHVRNVSRLIDEKTRDFVGRRFLFDLVGQELERSSCILLKAEPGFGKTSFLAEMVKRHRHVHHFNRLASADANQTGHFLANICAQLILAHRLPHPVLPVDAQRGSAFLLQLCEEAAARLEPGRRLLLVVDALDEVDRQGEPTTRNPLDLPEVLPERCCMVLTARIDQAPPLHFEGPFFQKDLDARSGENFADLEEYVRRLLGRGAIPELCRRLGISEEAMVERLSQRSEGNFMYLRYVMEDLEKGRFEGDSFEKLPQGLENYYQQQWQRLEARTGASFYELAVPTLAALTAFRRPVSTDLIAQLIGRPGDRPKILPILASLRQFLRIEDHPEVRGAKLYQLYHSSFHDFVRHRPEVAEQNIDEQVLRFFGPRRKPGKGK